MLSLEELQRRAAALQAVDEADWARWRRWAAAPAALAGDPERLREAGHRLLAEGVRLAGAAARGRVDPEAHAHLRAALRALRAHRAELRRGRGAPGRPPDPPAAAGA
jgi:hypothetical protein